MNDKNNAQIVLDRTVSLKAKGLYYFLLHLDLEKDYSIEAIASCNKGTSETRITPADAGKTQLMLHYQCSHQDHPR